MREFIRYGQPKPKEWSKAMGYWQQTNDSSMARQFNEELPPLAEEVEAHPFDDYYGLGQGPSVWEVALKTASDIFKEREARKTAEARAAAEAAKAATTPTGALWGVSWPPLVGVGAAGVVAYFLFRPFFDSTSHRRD